MAGSNVCPVHGEIKEDLQKMQAAQDGRPCQDHTARIKILEDSDTKQWDHLEELKKMAWKGKGIMIATAAIGSAVGGLLMNIGLHFLKK